MNNKLVLTFIGGGNMAIGIIGGLMHEGWHKKQIQVIEPLEHQREILSEKFGIASSSDSKDLPRKSDVVVLAVKPQVMQNVIERNKACLTSIPGPIISIAAGIRMDQLQSWIGSDSTLVRVMPNTPALIGMGASALMANENCKKADKDIAEAILKSVGITAWVDSDDQMDAVTALSGSGPAYFFYFMELMTQCGIKLGLDPKLCEQFVLQTALGSAHLAKQQQLAFSELRKQVTSPGGTTERALAIFQEYGLDNTVCSAQKAAYDRSKELSDEINS